MDETTKTLLVAVARTVLRVLSDRSEDAHTPVSSEVTFSRKPSVQHGDDEHTPVSEATFRPSDFPAQRTAQHGDSVQFWNGNMWCVGKVVSVCRKKEGKPPSVNVRVEKPSGRGKSYKVEIARTKVVRAA